MAERRHYKRLDHIFPVEFRFVDEENQPLSGWYQAFTQDVSEAGLCLTVHHLEFGDMKFLANKNILLSLNIHIPLGAKGVCAIARLAWFKTLRDEPSPQYVIGVCYEKIDRKDNQGILRYVTARRFFRGMSIAFSLLLGTGLVLVGYQDMKLRYENEKLLVGLSRNLSHQEALSKGQDVLKSQTEELKFLLSQSDRKIEALQRKLLVVSQGDQKTTAGLERAVDFLKKYQEQIHRDLTGLEAKKVMVDDDVKLKAQEASLLERKIRDKLCRWLAVHQNNQTGLVASFEGDKDINDWAFTYDQALAAIVFIKGGDMKNAGRIIDFYLTAKKADSGAFANAYYASTGDVAEYMAHTGPNIWLGLAVLQYAYTTKDMRYMSLARDIALWLETVKDNEGGLKGGKTLSWYSTEHNLDAYAFYSLLYDLTKEETYKNRAEETLQWLKQNAYSRIASPAVKRGKGDSTIATDTYAWSITAIGPQRLKEIGMDPDGIMDFAITNCSVSVEYQRPEGPAFNVRGFDFAKSQNLARGGVVSCEWTGQMILALKIMADYYRQLRNTDKASYYAQLANLYISELSKMIITSPSPVGQGEFCLPYASHEFADTGHGWRTPKGNRTGSVAATAYAILAIEGFNPLKFNG